MNVYRCGGVEGHAATIRPTALGSPVWYGASTEVCQIGGKESGRRVSPDRGDGLAGVESRPHL